MGFKFIAFLGLTLILSIPILRGQNNNLYYLDKSVVDLTPTVNGNIISLKGMYIEGREKPADGVWTVFYDQSFTEEAYQVTILEGRIQGARTEWYKNGNIKSEGVYTDWACISGCRRYDESGEIYYERLYDPANDIERSWNTLREMKETTFLNKVPIKSVLYFKNGKVKREYFYKPSSTNMGGYEPFVGVEFNEQGVIIGSLRFFQEFSYDTLNLEEKVTNKIAVDSIDIR